MVNILDAVKGGTLEYGTTMECDKVLQDWISTSSMSIFQSQSSSQKWGKFLAVGPKQESNLEKTLETLVKEYQNASVEESSLSLLNRSDQMLEVAKLLSQPDTQKLLGLALATTYGKPLRYCVQHEIVPAAGYWSHFANQVQPFNSQKKVAILIVETSNPVLAISRAICPLISKGVNIILVPADGSVALPCLALAEIINKAGIACNLYAGSPDRIDEIASLEEVDIILCTSYDRAHSMRNKASYLELDADGKKAIVAMETGDCDAAVDAALGALKSSGNRSPGLYLIVQDSVLEDIKWRLKERFMGSRAGDLLDKMTDFPSDSRFQAPKQVADFFENTQLDVVKVGNARVVFNAQPSLPIAQWSQIGQTLLVLSYRTVAELINILGNLRSLTELSLWVEQQSVLWQVVNQVQALRIWVNGIDHHEPGFDHLIPVQRGKIEISATEGKTNSVLYSVLDGLRAAQKSWATAGNRALLLGKFVKQLLRQDEFSATSETLWELGRMVGKGNVISAKSGVIFQLNDAIGLIGVFATDSGNVDALIRVVILALLTGNAVVISASSSVNSIVQLLIKAAKDSGIPNVVNVCAFSDENSRALLKHHGVQKLIAIGSASLPAAPEAHVKGIWQFESEIPSVDDVTHNKWVWMAVGDGLAN